MGSTFRSIRPAADVLLLLAVVVCDGSIARAASPAPEWSVSEWINADPGRLADQRGRVLLIHFFQLWCPGCREFSTPLFERWSERYGQRGDVLLVSIHSVFEGHAYQTTERLREFVALHGITHPVGVDSYASPEDETPVTMQRFRTRGTPQVVVVDRRGNIRFNHFGSFDPAPVERLIDELLGEPVPGGTEEAEQADRRLSGIYELELQQIEKSCGTPLPPISLEALVRVYPDRLVAETSRALFGLNRLEAQFDPRRSAFEAHLDREVDSEAAPSDVTLTVRGWIDDREEAPRVQFEAWLDKTGQDPAWDCEVTVRGSGTRKSER